MAERLNSKAIKPKNVKMCKFGCCRIGKLPIIKNSKTPDKKFNVKQVAYSRKLMTNSKLDKQNHIKNQKSFPNISKEKPKVSSPKKKLKALKDKTKVSPVKTKLVTNIKQTKGNKINVLYELEKKAFIIQRNLRKHLALKNNVNIIKEQQEVKNSKPKIEEPAIDIMKDPLLNDISLKNSTNNYSRNNSNSKTGNNNNHNHSNSIASQISRESFNSSDIEKFNECNDDIGNLDEDKFFV